MFWYSIAYQWGGVLYRTFIVATGCFIIMEIGKNSVYIRNSKNLGTFVKMLEALNPLGLESCCSAQKSRLSPLAIFLQSFIWVGYRPHHFLRVSDQTYLFFEIRKDMQKVLPDLRAGQNLWGTRTRTIDRRAKTSFKKRGQRLFSKTMRGWGDISEKKKGSEDLISRKIMGKKFVYYKIRKIKLGQVFIGV